MKLFHVQKPAEVKPVQFANAVEHMRRETVQVRWLFSAQLLSEQMLFASSFLRSLGLIRSLFFQLREKFLGRAKKRKVVRERRSHL